MHWTAPLATNPTSPSPDGGRPLSADSAAVGSASGLTRRQFLGAGTAAGVVGALGATGCARCLPRSPRPSELSYLRRGSLPADRRAVRSSSFHRCPPTPPAGLVHPHGSLPALSRAFPPRPRRSCSRSRRSTGSVRIRDDVICRLR
ncbi:MAG: twin-arginine translocation signal domain-containing protein [Proteobacteria bacterium]|nr:twin-arginine translocation signal domain-containing protein [Pseudomonadota bacterium]